MENIKKIKIRDEEFMYEILYYTNEFDSYEKTIFFKECKIKLRKKYFLFGKQKKTIIPHVLFTLNNSIESIFFTKDVVDKMIERASAMYFREKEILNGEII